MLALLLGAAAVALFVGIGIAASNGEGNPAAPPSEIAGDTATSRVSFVAVGDNLPEVEIAAYADSCAGEVGDGLYDFRPVFRPVKEAVQSADLAYINFETHAGGDEIGPRGYPSFNTMDAMVDAVYDTGFDLIASATNHSYDWGPSALQHSVSLWRGKPVLYTGTANSEEEAAAIHVYEKNGIVFSLLNYTYGVNGYDESDIPAYAINFMHEDRIRRDVAQARHISDVVMVSMHWGTENLMEVDATQGIYAQLLADAGADVVLGSHPHVIGPMEWRQGKDGHRTLVAYSLGNFISNHEAPLYTNELEGMLQCDFVKTAEGVRIENVAWVPLVNHTEPGNYAVYMLRDYTPELAARHVKISLVENVIGLMKSKTAEVIGTNFEIDV